MTTAKDIQPGQTVLVPPAKADCAAVVFRVTRTPNGNVHMVFLAPNARNMIGWIAEPDDPVIVAPLEPVLPWDGKDWYTPSTEPLRKVK